MRHFLFLLTLVVNTYAEEHPALSDTFIDEVNDKAATWTAGRNFNVTTPMEIIRQLMGVPMNKTNVKLAEKKIEDFIDQELPIEFDAREQWPECPSIDNIIDQGSCSSCWAFSTITAMTDRVCIHSGGREQHQFSAKDILSCCKSCGEGCGGGYPEQAWQHWVEHGIVSGGPYGSDEGCLPYEFPPCEHHITGVRPVCVDRPLAVPTCSANCVSTFNGTYENDKNYGISSYSISQNETKIRQEIFMNGPLVAAIAVYEDLLHYKNGVYVHVMGDFIGGHAVRIIGWGVEDDLPFWLVANSWNMDWGDNGLFKISRGYNECNIEERVSAGFPKENDDAQKLSTAAILVNAVEQTLSNSNTTRQPDTDG